MIEGNKGVGETGKRARDRDREKSEGILADEKEYIHATGLKYIYIYIY